MVALFHYHIIDNIDNIQSVHKHLILLYYSVIEQRASIHCTLKFSMSLRNWPLLDQDALQLLNLLLKCLTTTTSHRSAIQCIPIVLACLRCYCYHAEQISCVSASNSLRNRLQFPRYFQLLSTVDTIAFGFYGVIREYGWRRIAIIVQDENVFTEVSQQTWKWVWPIIMVSVAKIGVYIRSGVVCQMDQLYIQTKELMFP